MNETVVETVDKVEAVAARIRGEDLLTLPEDLYIPPDALEVVLEAFEGPLDLLLYLIRKQNLDILDIPVLKIAQQYIQYIELMQEMRFELAAEYLLMATMLAEIKSRMLLPRQSEEEDEGNDPRAELVRRLQEYERYKSAAEEIDEMPRVNRDFHIAKARPEKVVLKESLPQPELRELLYAFREVMLRAELFSSHQVTREPLSVRERMTHILDRLNDRKRVGFVELIDPEEGRLGVVVCFIAVLELGKNTMIELIQAEPFAPIELRLAGAYDDRQVAMVPEPSVGTDKDQGVH